MPRCICQSAFRSSAYHGRRTDSNVCITSAGSGLLRFVLDSQRNTNTLRDFLIGPGCVSWPGISPRPYTMMFHDFGLDESIIKSIDELGFTTPTPIQAGSIPHILAGKDVIGSAQTGPGKTAA